MSAYVVVQIDVTDPVRYEDYKKLVPESLAKFGGRFIVRGGRTETLEGTWAPRRFVMVEFPDMERARAWWASEEYAEAKALRQATSSTEMIVVEGV
ncbi:MAG TPA: DUF1330 domain-containing protein [Vicinamibacterales bacterium]|jgi:uncharacterized protein (DUF1330 family)